MKFFEHTPWSIKKIMGLTVIILVIFSVCLVITTNKRSQQDIGDQPPTIHITCNGTEINAAIQKVSWNGIAYEKSFPFKLIMSHQRRDELSRLSIGSELVITFDDVSPESIKILDMEVTDNGIPLVGIADAYQEVLNYGDSPCTYRLKSATSEQGKKLRGIMVEYSHGEDKCWYGIVVSTD